MLQNDGNLVVKDPSGKELWRSTSKSTGEKTDYFLVLGKKGRVELYKGVTLQDPNHLLVWASEDNQASDRNGECQCHVTNQDGSPGTASGDSFSVCRPDGLPQHLLRQEGLFRRRADRHLQARQRDVQSFLNV